VKDPLGDTFGGPSLANDNDLKTSCRTYYTNYTYFTLWNWFPRIIFTTDKDNHFDQIVVFNRRLESARERTAGAFLQVLLYYPLVNTTLWTASLDGAQYIYNFTNVYTGASNAPSPSALPSLAAEPSPSAEPTSDPTIYYYYSPPSKRAPPAELMVTIDQPNGRDALLIAEVVFKKSGQVIAPSISFDSTTKRNPGVLRGNLTYGPESLVLDGDLDTFFYSGDAISEEDADPTLILYASSSESSFDFDQITVYNVRDAPLQQLLAGAVLRVFYFTSSTKQRDLLFSSTFNGAQAMYDFTGIEISAPTATP
jgi:hypothetical protein